MVFHYASPSRQTLPVEDATPDHQVHTPSPASEQTIETSDTAANDPWRCTERSSRSDAAGREVTLQRAGGLLKADVALTTHQGETVVRKDYRLWQRTALAPLARYLMKREARMLQRLSGWAHTPEFKGTDGRYAFYMSRIDGMDLGEARRRSVPVRYSEIQRMVGELHRFHVTHNDLRWTNILVTPEGRLVLIDFASAFHAAPRSPLRPIMNRLRRADMAGTLKFKQKLTGRGLTPTEQRLKTAPRWLSMVRRGWKHQMLPRLKRH
ncbi:lipopolysaccharide kinase InaA family protein [Kushneria indalinina]|uniref:Lipopolysaccharide kinase (Kdo/WaaP) family protein n=1 Tax=Kushneria indalinina DSM 14324 TaxID=1122140 RepID=A0A3D9DV85_9GAMM|nr:lipopolysaccharide kinase InaA family protein [Kushneria indalinina]REC94565.1 lipopolysaccharide kinase (Kdo/WaaP) family protein [Kushneria indalinina DSM 14324]